MAAWESAPLVDAPKAAWESAPVVGQDSTPFQKVAASAVERFNALRSGVTETFIPGVLGMPMQTAENVVNLSRAAAGTIAGAVGRPDMMPGLVSFPGNTDTARRVMQVLGLTVSNPDPSDSTNKAFQIAGGIVPTLAIPGARLGQTAASTAGAVVGERMAGPQGELVGALAPAAASAAYGGMRGGSLAAQQKAHSVRDETIAKAREEGYKFAPSETNPTLPNRFLEGWAGKLSTRQMASAENSEVSTVLAKRSLKLPENEPLTLGAVEKVREGAWDVYQKVKDFGKGTNLRFKTDPDLVKDLNSLDSAVARASKEYPDVVNNPDIASLRSIATKPTHSPEALIELVKDLRFQSKANYRGTGEKPAQSLALADAQRKAANAVEAFLERRLTQSGQPQLLQEFRDARQTIARSYDVEAALNESTGTVNARVFANLMDRGRPLGADLTTIAKTYKAAPKDLQTPESIGSQPGISPVDFGVGTIAAAGANPGIAATIFGRPLVRSAIMSAPYQKLMGTPSYTPALTGDSALASLLRGYVSAPLTQLEKHDRLSQ